MPARRNARSTRYCRVPRRLPPADASCEAITQRVSLLGGAGRGQSPAGGGAPFGRGGEAGGPAVEIALEDLHQCRLDRDPAVLAALAADLDDGPVVAASN